MRNASLQRLKPNKTWAVLGAALTIGVLAALGARSFLANRIAAIEARALGETVNVVVAKRELRKGEKLTTENVAVRPIPADYAHSGAVNPETFDRIEGQALAYPVKGGEMILWGLLEGRRVPTFSARVEAGRRAITVAVDEINSISGLLEPGDTVDLMVSVEQKGRKLTLPFLEGVQVLATGQRSVDDPKSGGRRQYSTVTLDTTPEQARHVIVAREAGKITALLRNPQDRAPNADRSVDIAAMLGLAAAVRALPPDEDRQVPVLYGGRGVRFPPEGLTLGRYVRADAGAQAAQAMQAIDAAQAVQGLQAVPSVQVMQSMPVQPAQPVQGMQPLQPALPAQVLPTLQSLQSLQSLQPLQNAAPSSRDTPQTWPAALPHESIDVRPHGGARP